MKSQEIRNRKRAKFSQAKAKPKLSVATWFIVGGVLIVAITLLAWMGRGSGSAEAQNAGDPQEKSVAEAGGLPVRDGAVRLPVSTFDDGQARWYTYHANGTDIGFFVLKSSDGVIRAAFNACDVCFLAKKGYSQEGDEMVCNNCGQRFPSVLINEVKGGCNPSPLARTIEGDEVAIRVDDILAGAGYFQ